MRVGHATACSRKTSEGRIKVAILGMFDTRELEEFAETLAAYLGRRFPPASESRTDPGAKRTFRTPLPWIIGPVGILGCAYLFYSLPTYTQEWFLIWNTAGLAIYFLFAAKSAHRTRSATGA